MMEADRVSFLQTNDPYSLVERLIKRGNLQSYANLITLTSFQGRSRGLDYPTTFLMISDVASVGDYYLAGRNTGYNNQQKIQNSLSQAWARSLRTFNKSHKNFSSHPFGRSSNLRVLGFSSHLAAEYAGKSFTDSLIQDLTEISAEQSFNESNKSFRYDPDTLINDVLKSNYMLDVVEGPNLDEFTSNDLSRVSNPESKYMLSEKEGIFQNPSDQLIASIRQYLYAENLEKYYW